MGRNKTIVAAIVLLLRGGTMKKLFFTIILFPLLIGAQVSANSYTLRYFDGFYSANISGLKSERDCEKLARQKRLSSSSYYCMSTGQKHDTRFESDNNWR